MSVEVEFNLLSHKYELFCKWLEACEKKFGEETYIPIWSIKKTIKLLNKIEERVDQVFIDVLTNPTTLRG